MGKMKDRKYKIQSARKRAEEHESGGSGMLKVPDGVSWWSIKSAGRRTFDIIGYVTGHGNPHADEGVLHYERTYWAHFGLGPNNDRCICALKTFKKPCFPCEYRSKLMRSPERLGFDPEEQAEEIKNLIASLNPKERQLFNIIDSTDSGGGIKLWDFSFHNFGKFLDEKIKDSDEEDGYEYFFTPDRGLRLRVGFSEKSMGGGRPFYQGTNIEFRPRDPYDDDIVEQAICLDELFVCPDYEEVKKIFLGGSDSEESHNRSNGANGNGKTSPKTQSRKVEEDEEDPEQDELNEEQEDDDNEPAPSARGKANGKQKTAKEAKLAVGDFVTWSKKPKISEFEIMGISSDGTSLKLEDPEGELHKGVAVSEVRKVLTRDDLTEDEDEPEETPKKKPASNKKRPSYDEEE